MILPHAKDVRNALSRWPTVDLPPHTGRKNNRHAGVLVPLRWRDDLECVLILRTAHLRTHPGEIGYPGGRPEPGDVSLADTALREAREELGIEGAEILGRISSIPLFTSDFRLEPFVARIDQDTLTPEPGEVERILIVGIGATLSLPHIDAIPFSGWGTPMLSPVFDIGAHRLFGGTAHSFLELLQLLAPLMGRAVPPPRAGRYTWADIKPEVERGPLPGEGDPPEPR